MTKVSPRLITQLSTSCKKMDSGTILALAASVKSGDLPWFMGEFEAALDGGFTLAQWAQITELDVPDKTTGTKHVSRVWTAVDPNGRPFPGMHWS